MIDLHCHILPGVDDGPATWGQAISMAKKAAADGIYILVATPHIHVTPGADINGWAFKKKIERNLAQLRYYCTVLEIPVILSAGGELDVRMDPESCRPFTLNDTHYVLVEFPHMYLPVDAAETLFSLMTAGLTPIIAHPERNHTVIERPERLIDLARSGALVQITGGSLLGEFGRHAKACAEYFLKLGVVSFLASDAHSPSERQPVLSSSVRAAARIIGTAAARDLVVTNPGAVLAGTLLSNKASMESTCLQSPF